MINLKSKTPHAAILIFNYDDRLGSSPTSTGTINKTENQNIISTRSIISIDTSKTKSSPAGSFTINLSPNINWLSRITVGSWICILMSQRVITEEDTKTASSDTLKFVGRIESVRINVVSDQTNGSRRTIYSISGNDWGDIFNNQIYIDRLLGASGQAFSISQAAGFQYNKLIGADKNKLDLFGTSYQNVTKVLSLVGNPSEVFKSEIKKANGSLELDTSNKILIPDTLKKFLNLDQDTDIIKNIFPKFGKLVGDDEYSTDNPDSINYLRPDDFFGYHSVWQLISEYSNPLLNETFCDLGFDGDKFRFKLYCRIKPFYIKPDGGMSVDGQVRNLVSEFKNIKKTLIDVGDVISFSAGNNWADKINFIEMRSTYQTNTAVITKINSQEADVNAIQREGLRGLVATSNGIPFDGSFKSEAEMQRNANTWEKFNKWKFLLKEWYFDTHRTLNGSMVVSGLSEHLEVGQNILIPMEVFGITHNVNQNDAKKKQNAYLLAHIENISNSFTINGSTRSYTSTISFVRGIVTDKNGSNTFVDGDGTIDQKVITMDSNSNVIETSTSSQNVKEQNKNSSSPNISSNLPSFPQIGF